MTLRNLLMASLLLCIAGCGCNDDTFPPDVGRLIQQGVLGVQFEGPRFEVAPNAGMVVPIDVVFLLDDGFRFNTDLLQAVPDQPFDRRPLSFTAQRIFDNLRTQVEARLDAAIDAIDPALLPAGFDKTAFKNQLDFAFAVARYEDFGGPFTRTDTTQPVDSAFNDADARPFILNMPILRVGHPQFATSFEGALARTAPGDGNIGRTTANKDPQSAIEALWQIAEGRGFDGNGVGGTNESGGPGSDSAQLMPGASGDVPAIAFGAAGQDPQDPSRPIYPVLDENGQPVTFNGQPVMSSGNIGGVGWRPNSARFVIVAGDIATVAPTSQAGFVSRTNDPAIGAQDQRVMSTAGGPAPDGAPRAAVGVPLTGFDADRPAFRPRIGPVEPTKEGQNPGILGGYAGVAPAGAHTVEETVTALNAKTIEVLCLAAPDQIPGHTKPVLDGDTEVNGDEDPADVFNFINDVNAFQPTFTPWTWMTGVSRLTGAVDPVKRTRKHYDNETAATVDIGNTAATLTTFDKRYLAGPVFDPGPGVNTNGIDVGHLALVYNLGNVWPYDPAAPDKTKGDETKIEPAVVDDLVKRIMEWVKGGYLSASAASTTKPALPTPVYEFELSIVYPEDTQLTHTPVGSQSTQGGLITETFPAREIAIPVNYTGDAQGAAPRIDLFPDEALQFGPASETLPTPWSEQVRFRVTGRLKRIDGQTAENASQVQAIRDQARERGDGFLVECTNEPGVFTTTPLPTETDEVTFAQGVFEVVVRTSDAPGPGGRLVLMDAGNVIVNDLSPGGIPGDQIGGSNLFATWPPASPFGCDTEAPAVEVPHDLVEEGTQDKLGYVVVTQDPTTTVDFASIVSVTDNRYGSGDLTVVFRRTDTTAIVDGTTIWPNPTIVEIEVQATDKAGNTATATFWLGVRSAP